MGTPSSQELGRAPPAPKGAVDGRVLSGQISKAGSTQELLRLSTTHSASLNHIHAANLWNKLGKQRDAFESRHREEMRLLLRRTVELVDACEARNLSNIAHGLAKCTLMGLDGETGALFAAVAEAAVEGSVAGRGKPLRRARQSRRPIPSACTWPGRAQYLTGPSHCTSPPAQRCAAAAAASPPRDSARRRRSPSPACSTGLLHGWLAL